MLPSRPAEARFLTAEQKTWLEGRLEAERQLASHGHSGHGSIWSVLTNKYVLVLAIIYSGSSATSNTLSLWMPQILKSFGSGYWKPALLNVVPPLQWRRPRGYVFSGLRARQRRLAALSVAGSSSGADLASALACTLATFVAGAWCCCRWCSRLPR